LVYLEDNGYIEAVPQRGQISLVPEEQMRQGASAGGGSRRGYGIMPLSPPPPPQPRAKAPEPAAPKPSGLVRFFPQRAQPAPAAPAPAPAAPVARQIPPLSPPPPPMQAAPVRREPEPAAYQPRPIQPPPPPPAQAYRPPSPAQPAYQAPPQPPYQQAPAAAAPRPMPPAPPPAPPSSPSTAVALHGGGSVQNTERVKQLLRYMARIMGPEAAPVLRKIQAVQTETEMNIMVNRLVTIVRYYKGAVESEQFANHFGP
jgi:hypothetical protein